MQSRGGTTVSISDRSLKLTESSLEAQAALEEYRTLRQEILNLQQQAYQITGLAFSIGSGVAALAAFAGKSEPAICGFVFLAMAIMYWPLIHSQVRRRNGIYWLGRYIEHVIEERIPGLHWESAWCRQTFKMNRELQG
jgi:hypothetical protein